MAHKQWSLCVFDDLLEYASTNAVKYKDYFLQPMLKCVCDKSPSVRQVSQGGGGGVRDPTWRETRQGVVKLRGWRYNQGELENQAVVVVVVAGVDDGVVIISLAPGC